MKDSSHYWEGRDEALKHPSGRARGGEPCVKCGAAVPANAHWKYRDRHVCSQRCNQNLNRQFNRRVKRGEIALPEAPDQVDPRSSLESKLFRSKMGKSAGHLLLEFEGYGPRAGDAVERYGELTFYFEQPVDQLPEHLADVAPHGALIAAHESGHLYAVALDDDGYGTRLVLGEFGSGGQRRPTHSPFEFNGRGLAWIREFIRDIGPDARGYTWEAPVCLTVGSGHPGTIWTAAYTARSEKRQRTSAATARHVRRLRTEAATVERFDPEKVFERDGWVCQLCHQPVNRENLWPDPQSPSLDHIIPLVAGGEHSRANTQLSHWICNVRKAARTIR